jgi:hypothetical protein
MRLDLLILVRLAKVEKQSHEDVVALLRPLIANDDVVERVLDGLIRGLVKDQHVTVGRGRKSPVGPLRITDRGRDHAARQLGVDSVPSWRAFRERFLPETVLGISIKKAEDMRAALIAERVLEHAAPSPSGHSQRLRSVTAIVETLLRTHARDLSTELVRRWATMKHRNEWTDDDVIKAVQTATRRVSDAGRFGGDRVFVSAIWRQLDQGAEFPGLSFDGFKKRLVAANQRRELVLARADLLGAMDPREVAASEIRYLNSTFHFVLDHSRA